MPWLASVYWRPSLAIFDESHLFSISANTSTSASPPWPRASPVTHRVQCTLLRMYLLSAPVRVPVLVPVLVPVSVPPPSSPATSLPLVGLGALRIVYLQSPIVPDPDRYHPPEDFLLDRLDASNPVYSTHHIYCSHNATPKARYTPLPMHTVRQKEKSSSFLIIISIAHYLFTFFVHQSPSFVCTPATSGMRPSILTISFTYFVR